MLHAWGSREELVTIQFSILFRLLLEVEEVQSDPKLAFPGNPINALRLIRRFITLWNDVHRSLQDPAPAAGLEKNY